MAKNVVLKDVDWNELNASSKLKLIYDYEMSWDANMGGYKIEAKLEPNSPFLYVCLSNGTYFLLTETNSMAYSAVVVLDDYLFNITFNTDAQVIYFYNLAEESNVDYYISQPIKIYELPIIL